MEENRFEENGLEQPSEDKQQTKHDRMGTDPILPLIFKMSLPSMFSMFIQACYNVVDSIYVSRLGEYALSAVSLVYPIQMLNVACGVGLSVGLSSLISRRLGEKNYKAAQDAANHGMFIATMFWVLFLLFGLFGSKPFIMAFSSTPELIDAGIDYCRICCIGSLAILNASALEKTMQACGNMMAPMWCMLSGAITNIILDPIMIFGYLGCPAMGVAGAAVATVVGQCVTLIVTVFFIQTSALPIHIKLRGFVPRKKTIGDIMSVAFPSIIMQSIMSVLNVCMNAILIGFSETAVAVLGVYYKLQSFVFMPVFGMNHGLLPIMGFNYGAKNQRRLVSAYKNGVMIAMVIMTCGMLLFKLCPGVLLGFFNAEGELLEIGTIALKTISWSFPIAAFCIITSTLFQATAHGFYSLLISILRQLLAILPIAWLFSRIWGLQGIWWSFPIAEIVSLIASTAFYRHLWKTDISQL